MLEVVVPRRSLPSWVSARREVPVDDATLNGLVPALPCMLKEYDDDVALIPATVPLSRSDEVPSVVAVNQRVAYPMSPPVREEPPIPKVDVETHSVDVPVDQRTWPTVPTDCVESKREPRRVRLVVDALVMVALVAVSAEMKALVEVSPVDERLVVEALVAKSDVMVPTVVEELLKYA